MLREVGPGRGPLDLDTQLRKSDQAPVAEVEGEPDTDLTSPAPSTFDVAGLAPTTHRWFY